MRRYATLAAVLFFVFSAGAGEAGDALARHRESLGVDALWGSLESIRYTGTIASGGMEGTTEVLVVLPTEKPVPRPDGGYDAGGFVGGVYYRSEISLGPLRELVLITPAGGWLADPTGGVRELGGIELADYTASLVMDSLLYCRPDPALFSVAWTGREEVEGVLCDVLEFGPAAGGLPFHPRRYFLDASDGSLRRITSELSGVLHVTDCSQHRDFSGLRLPARFRTVLSGLPLVIEQGLTDVVLDGPVDAALLLPPVAERLTFPAEGLVRVPVELVGGGIFVQVRVNGEPVWMILDTGATMSVLSTAAAERLELAPAGTGAGVGTGGLGEVGILQAESLAVGGLTIENPALAAVDLDAFSRHFGREWGGVLGGELFARAVVEVDYAASALTIHDPEGYAPPEPKPGAVELLPLRLEAGLPVVEAELDGLRGSFVIDLGNLNYTAVYRPAVMEHGLQERYPEWRPHLVSGFGGFGHHRLVEAGSLRLGSTVIPGPLVVLAGEVEGAFARTTETGNIGQDILGRFSRVTLDYPGGRLILELGPDGLGEGSQPDRLGFTAAGRTVVLVWEGTPAQRAGLSEGDVILALDGQSAENLSGVELAEWASAEPGTPRTITVRRDGREFELSMTTEELW